MAIITVVMPVYNAIGYLQQAIKSILIQTFSDFTFLIIDDGSTDGSAEYIDSIRDSRVKILKQENKGIALALNAGLSLCQTPFLARMDADDVSLPVRLGQQLEFIKNHDDVVLLGTQVRFFVGDKSFSGPKKPLNDESIRRSLLARVPAICHGSCVMRADVLKGIGGYENLRGGEEFDMFLRMSERGRLANLGNVLYNIRVHKASTCYAHADVLQRNVRFSIEQAKLREKGIPQPSMADFAMAWKKRIWVRKVIDWIDWRSGILYRQSFLDRGADKKIRGLFRLTLAAIFRPRRTLSRVAGLFYQR